MIKNTLLAIGVLLVVGLLAHIPITALAQTPDGETPAVEDICDGETGRAYGLCNAYCEAMDCENADTQASIEACDTVFDKYMDATGQVPPCVEPRSCADLAECAVVPCPENPNGVCVLGCNEAGCTCTCLVIGP